MAIRANIYGDSIMKGTVIDEGRRYHATVDGYLARFREAFGIEAENRARFGITIERGHRIMKKDVDAGLSCEFALIEFGGNDSDFKWNEISAAPDIAHDPLTLPGVFEDTLHSMIAELRTHGVKPILMTLPPVDGERYLDFLTGEGKGNDRASLLKWLGGTAKTIFDFHEGYSDAVERVALAEAVPLCDVRSAFFGTGDFPSFIGLDGVHPNARGYELISNTFEGLVKRILA